MSKYSNIIVSKDNNIIVSKNNNNKTVSEDNNKIMIEHNNNNDDDDDYKIKEINNIFKMIDETKLFEEQKNLLREMDDLDLYWHMKYNYDKELNLKIFKLKYAHISEDLDENLFEETFGHTFVTLANKLINTTSKEENQIIINDIEKNNDKIFE